MDIKPLQALSPPWICPEGSYQLVDQIQISCGAIHPDFEYCVIGALPKDGLYCFANTAYTQLHKHFMNTLLKISDPAVDMIACVMHATGRYLSLASHVLPLSPRFEIRDDARMSMGNKIEKGELKGKIQIAFNRSYSREEHQKSKQTNAILDDFDHKTKRLHETLPKPRPPIVGDTLRLRAAAATDISPYDLGQGNLVTEIRFNQDGYIVLGLNANQEMRSICVHGNGTIVGYDGKPLSGFVASQIKAQIKQIFEHFEMPLPTKHTHKKPPTPAETDLDSLHDASNKLQLYIPAMDLATRYPMAASVALAAVVSVVAEATASSYVWTSGAIGAGVGFITYKSLHNKLSDPDEHEDEDLTPRIK
ncbi:MAG: hypothetical protein K0U52_06420 [Gammaproteobacteria bacterium]|nr:hypothetical protein [Gammaproteobacteria bacterium]